MTFPKIFSFDPENTTLNPCSFMRVRFNQWIKITDDIIGQILSSHVTVLSTSMINRLSSSGTGTFLFSR